MYTNIVLKVVVFGPGPKSKGGISNYTSSLAIALHDAGCDVTIISWSHQYPFFIPRDFIDHSSKKDVFDGRKITVEYLTNYNNPISWNKTVDRILEINPAKIIFQWAITIQGLPMGYISKKLKGKGPEIIFDCHNVVQKENSSMDVFFTKKGLANADTFIVHGDVTIREYQQLFPDKKIVISNDGLRNWKNEQTIIKLFHPIYDLFKTDESFDIEAFKSELGLKKHVFLFFGFIRKYKGLHWAIEAFHEFATNRDDVSLLIVGESFWNTLDQTKLSTRLKKGLFKSIKSIFLKKEDDESDYNPLALIEKLNLKNKVVVVNEFVPNEKVYQYFSVSDAILLFYTYATPSGVESIAYNFGKPMLATKVGHFNDAIIEGYNGYTAFPDDINSMANAMKNSIEKPISETKIKEIGSKLSWANYVNAILK